MKKPLIERVFELLDGPTIVDLVGITPEEARRIEGNLDSMYAGVGGNDRFAERDFQDTIKELESNVLVGYGVATGIYLSNLRLTEQYKFSTIPGVRAAASTIDGIGQFLGAYLSSYESIKHEYGMMGKQTFQYALGGAALTFSAVRTVRQLARARQAIVAAQGLRRVWTGVRAVGAAARAAAITGPVQAVTAAAVTVAEVVGGTAVYRAVSKFMEDRAERLALQANAHYLTDRSRLIEDFNLYRSSAVFRADPEGIYDSLRGIITDEFYGMTGQMYGMDYRSASQIAHNMSRFGFVNTGNAADYATRVGQMSAIFGYDMEDIFTGLSRIATTTDESGRTRFGAEIDEAQNLFETFFSSLVVDGRLHMAQLGLLGELSRFTESYVLGTKFNLESGAQNLARTHAFLSPIFGDRQTTAITETLVRNLDDALVQGALGYNPHMNLIMARTGMTAGEAIGGITSSPEVLEKFLHGMYLQLGIGNNAFDENGELSNRDMERFIAYSTHGLGLDQNTMTGVYAAYRAYVGGKRGEDVSREYSENIMEEATREAPEASLIKLTQSWTEGSIILTDLVMKYADLMIRMDVAITKFASAFVPRLTDEMVRHYESVANNVLGVTSRATPVQRGIYRMMQFGRSVGGVFTAGVSTRLTREAQEPLGRLQAPVVPGGRALPAEFFSEIDKTLRGGIAFESLFNSLIYQESRGVHRNPDGTLLRSPAGALGITQVMPATGRAPGFGVAPLRNDSEEEYLRFGRDYLNAMINYYDGDIARALGAYNWGSGNVNRAYATHGKDWIKYAPQETQDYLSKILGRISQGMFSVGGKVYGFAPESASGEYNYASSRGSQIVANYVNIDVELNGVDSRDAANYFQSHFMRA